MLAQVRVQQTPALAQQDLQESPVARPLTHAKARLHVPREVGIDPLAVELAVWPLAQQHLWEPPRRSR